MSAHDEIGAAERGNAIEAAHALVRWSMRLLDISGAGVMLLSDRGVLRSVMVTSELVHTLEAAELRYGRGPCVESHRRAHPVIYADVAAPDARWPEFGRLARAGGVRAAHAVPVVGDGTAVGVLNLFRATPGGLSDTDAVLAEALAGSAGAAIRRRAAAPAGPDGVDLVTAIADAAIVQRAAGMLAVRLQLDVDEAHAVLRRVAVDRRLGLAALADGVVADTAAVTLPLVIAPPPGAAGTD